MSDCGPDHAPEAVQEVAFTAVQRRRLLSLFARIRDALRVRLTLGGGGVTGVMGAGDAAVLPSAQLVQEAASRKAKTARAQPESVAIRDGAIDLSCRMSYQVAVHRNPSWSARCSCQARREQWAF